MVGSPERVAIRICRLAHWRSPRGMRRDRAALTTRGATLLLAPSALTRLALSAFPFPSFLPQRAKCACWGFRYDDVAPRPAFRAPHASAIAELHSRRDSRARAWHGV